METPSIVKRITDAVMDMRGMNIQPTDVFLCMEDARELSGHPFPLSSRCTITEKEGLKLICSIINIDGSCLDVHYLKSGDRSVITIGDVRKSKVIRVF